MKKVFTRPRLILLGKVVSSLLLFAIGAIAVLWSALLADMSTGVTFWPGGYAGVFCGLIILIWNYYSIRDSLRLRALTFLCASELIWVVLWLIVKSSSRVVDYYWFVPMIEISHIPMFIGILFGTVLLPLVHAILLELPFKQALISIPIIYGAAIVMPIIGTILDPFCLYTDTIKVGYIISWPVWQITYLISMFGFSKKEKEVEAAE